jgi:hypothetical protein
MTFDTALRMTIVAVVTAGAAAAQEHAHPAAPGEKLGTVHFATSCRPAAASSFDRAVALLHSFEFGTAVDAFRQAQALDPACAVTEWGIALSRWGNPFAVGARAAAALGQGREAIAHARAMGGGATPRERAYIDAAAQLYENFEQRPQRARVLAYRDAMAALAAAHPDDEEAAIFYALSLTASEDLADKTYASRLKAGAILEPLFAKHPDHPGLAHYIIHSYDVPALAPKAVDAARRYAAIAPSAPHALHMPSHTFTRIGAWQDSIDTNIASAEAAKRVRTPSEELHATDYQMYAYLQTAQDAAARRLLDSLPELVPRFEANPSGAAAPPEAGWFAASAIPARWTLERGAWAEAARLEPRSTALPYVDALTWFARALGAARSGDTAAARSAVTQLEALRDREAAASEPYWTGQIAIQRDAAAAWLLFAEGHRDDAIAAMRAAAAAEDRTEKSAMTPGPLAPARELLGEMLLEANQPAGALPQFEATLGKEPHRFRATYGAAKAARLAGQPAVADRYFKQLLSMCGRADQPGRPELREARGR